MEMAAGLVMAAYGAVMSGVALVGKMARLEASARVVRGTVNEETDERFNFHAGVVGSWLVRGRV